METAPVATEPPPKSKRQRKRDHARLDRARVVAQRRARAVPAARCGALDLWAVLKIALCFYLAAVVLVIVAGIVLWLIADAAGAIHNVESFMGKILSSKNYHLVVGADPRGLDPRRPRARGAHDDHHRRRRRALQPVLRARRRRRGHARRDRPPARRARRVLRPLGGRRNAAGNVLVPQRGYSSAG